MRGSESLHGLKSPALFTTAVTLEEFMMSMLAGETWLEFKTFVRQHADAQRDPEEIRKVYISVLNMTDTINHLKEADFWAVIDVLLDLDYGFTTFNWVEKFKRHQAEQGRIST